MHLSRSYGFTLIEVLVVIVLIGIVLATVSLSFTRDDRAILTEETDRLALLLQAAADDAILTGKAIAWSQEGGEYKFWRQVKDEWQPIEVEEQFHLRRLPANVQLTALIVNNATLPPGELLVFSPGGVATPFEATLAMGDARSKVRGDAIGRVRAVPGA